MIAGIRFDAEEVIAGELRLDAFEQRLSRARHGEQRPTRSARQRFEAFAARLPVGERIHRRTGVRDVEQLVIELQRINARARLRRHRAEIGDHRDVGQHEAFRNQDQRLGGVDTTQPGEQIAEILNGLFRFNP